MKSTSWVISLPAEGGGLRSKTEGERGTFKSAIIIDYAFSLSLAHARQLPPGRSLEETEPQRDRGTSAGVPKSELESFWGFAWLVDEVLHSSMHLHLLQSKRIYLRQK